MATTSSDKTIKLWNVDGFTEERTLTGKPPMVCARSRQPGDDCRSKPPDDELLAWQSTLAHINAQTPVGLAGCH